MHIAYWKQMAQDDYDALFVLLEGKKFLQSLFFIHLTAEKLLKAFYVKDNEVNIPPKTHNLITLYNQTSLNLSEEQTNFLQALNVFQLEGRYPDYTNQLYQIANKEYVNAIIDEFKPLYICLIEMLQ